LAAHYAKGSGEHHISSLAPYHGLIEFTCVCVIYACLRVGRRDRIVATLRGALAA